jgi:hypothetical protein
MIYEDILQAKYIIIGVITIIALIALCCIKRIYKCIC